ncbi:hypothetical protein [Vitiosangium sp. GDMCC 1.1324]|uniref:hypothetical protein n=1 Tax=Vitiosangium sp. (strain GDMCC 1.1324) TaxID=2138576 RepID=UPI000D35DC94|nr:hypothetical protein [Vitiosangium sp. GDMCC 1.1324]PTL76025.1 hypothetical protein DAT35_51810 [Vitiosangium sp. GDMCC 1.1324]
MRVPLLLLTLTLGMAGCARHIGSTRPVAPQAPRTHWTLEPSQAFDALAVVNLLRDDPFYVTRYPEAARRFSERLGPTERRALEHLTQRLKVQAGEVVPAKLMLVFSTAQVATLEDLVRTVEDDAAWGRLRQAYLATSYGEGEDFSEMNDVREDLRVLLRYLRDIGFAQTWTQEDLPALQRFIEESQPRLSAYDVIALDEEVLGRRLPTEGITAYVLRYAKPHGIRVAGWRFVTDVTYPLEVTVKTALHELLHPPFTRTGELHTGLSAMERDPFFQRLVKEHDPAFGYTTPEGLTEEDCAEAIDVFNAERLGLLRTKTGESLTGAQFFARHDDGIHVVAFILYQELRRVRDWSTWKGYEDFLLGLLRDGRLAPGQLEATFRSYPDAYEVKALAGRP